MFLGCLFTWGAAQSGAPPHSSNVFAAFSGRPAGTWEADVGGSAGVRAPGRAHSGTQELQAKGLLHQWRPEMFVILGVDDPPQPRVCVCVCVSPTVSKGSTSNLCN